MSLAGKNALVTGARRNIGRGIAQALAQSGCNVGINDLECDADAEQTLQLIGEQGRETEFFTADISDAGQVEGMIAGFLDRFGRIDILVNNPYYAVSKPFLEISEEIWNRTVDVSLKGFFLCSQRTAKAMVEQGDGGNIVSISSVHARRAWSANTCYGVAKAGILRLTEGMALELGEYGIRCNAILPGYMDTEHVFGTGPPALGSINEELKRFAPIGRRGTPEDIGLAVAFLCSPAAANITGVSIPVDGGLLITGSQN